MAVYKFIYSVFALFCSIFTISIVEVFIQMSIKREESREKELLQKTEAE